MRRVSRHLIPQELRAVTNHRWPGLLCCKVLGHVWYIRTLKKEGSARRVMLDTCCETGPAAPLSGSNERTSLSSGLTHIGLGAHSHWQANILAPHSLTVLRQLRLTRSPHWKVCTQVREGIVVHPAGGCRCAGPVVTGPGPSRNGTSRLDPRVSQRLPPSPSRSGWMPTEGHLAPVVLSQIRS